MNLISHDIGKAGAIRTSGVLFCMPILAIAGTGALTQPASAQTARGNGDNAGRLEEIVVTAQKRAENLQDVPIAVSAISGERLAAAGVVDTLGLANAISGFTVNINAQNFSPHVRGVGTSAFGPGIENPVALYVDNVYYASQIMGLADLTDVEQVSVLKGPQGTLFGRNATGGVIQLTTRQPSDTFGGQLRTELDQYMTSRSNLYVTGPLAENLKANLSVRYTTQGDGWGRNLFNDDEIHKIDHDVGIRSKLVFTPGENTTITLSGDYSDTINSLGPNLRPLPGTTAFLPGFSAAAGEYDVDAYITNRNDSWNGGGSLMAKQDLGFARLVSITAYRKFRFASRFVPSMTPIPAFDIDFAISGKQFTQEVQLVSPDNDRFNWVIGAYYFWGREGIDRFRNSFYPALFGLDKIEVHGHETTASIAGFGQATMKVLPQTGITLGLRYTSEKRRIRDSFGEGLVNTPGGLISTGPLGAIQNDQQKINRLTWRLALDHRVTDDVMLYASYNRGFKSGGFNVYTPGYPSYQPEKLDAWEAGMKAELFDRRVRFNPSVFYYDYSDIQLVRYDTNAVIFNAKGAEIYGVDLDAEAQVTDRLRLNLGAEWLHTRLKTMFDPAAPNNPTCFSSLPGGGLFKFACDANGNRVPFAPKFTLNVGVNYTAAILGSKIEFSLTNAYNGGYTTEASSNRLTDPNGNLREKSFNIMSGAITWTSPDERLSVGAFVRNILNEVVPSQRSAQEPWGYYSDYTNPPRTYGANLTYRFGAF